MLEFALVRLCDSNARHVRSCRPAAARLRSFGGRFNVKPAARHTDRLRRGRVIVGRRGRIKIHVRGRLYDIARWLFDRGRFCGARGNVLFHRRRSVFYCRSFARLGRRNSRGGRLRGIIDRIYFIFFFDPRELPQSRFRERRRAAVSRFRVARRKRV